MIDVNKQLSHVSASTSKKADKSMTNLHNEIKIITSSDETFELWSELISNYAQGYLIDPDTEKKFKENKNWAPQKDGILNREFFKWIGNLTEADHRDLCRHMLNKSGPKRKYPYPKVTMKVTNGVLSSCYTAKEWLERRKRKHILRQELLKIKPSLSFYDKNGEFQKKQWKKFKKDYNVTSATMNVLLETPGDEFYGPAKQTKNRNKSIEELSPYAKEFFKLFLKQKKNFMPPRGNVFFRSYDGQGAQLGDWPRSTWEDHVEDLKLAIIDFRNIPGFTTVKSSTVQSPFFEEFIQLLCSQSSPGITDPPVWMWICGYKDAEVMVSSFANTDRFRSEYEIKYAEYEPSKYERLQDVTISHKLAKERIHLLFLVKKHLSSTIKIPSLFTFPDTPVYTKPRRYNEIEYRMYTNELRMEFYMRVLEIICKPMSVICTLFCGTKALCAAVVSLFSSTRAKLLESHFSMIYCAKFSYFYSHQCTDDIFYRLARLELNLVLEVV
jgi:hypothetical protein